jgi:GUN4-like/Caspase domain
MARKALLIGTKTYQDGFKPLNSAPQDVEALAGLLRNPEVGGFEAENVQVLLDCTSSDLATQIETWYIQHDKEDFALLFIAGHGVKDGDRKLHFAATNTQKVGDRLITTTAVAASSLSNWLRGSKAQRQIVILNCCFSGAFGDLVPMDDGAIDLEEELGVEGRVVMTSTSSMAYAFEQKNGELSVYGHYLAEGLRTGAAAAQGSDEITIDALHQYVSRKVQEETPAMVPRLFAKGEGYRLRIAKVALGDPKVQYRKAFDELVQQFGEHIKGLGRAKLTILQAKLGLSDAITIEIEAEVLDPIRQLAAKLLQYREIFTEGVKEEYPFDETQLQILSDIKKLLGLLDEDVAVVEAEVLATIPPKPEPEPIEVEFDRLQDLLQAQKWKEANDETLRLLLTLANRQSEGWLTAWNMRSFSQDNLNVIDGLWANVSQGRFGFGIQARRFATEVEPLNLAKPEAWQQFDNVVGWRKDNGNYYEFNLEATEGHLPHWRKLIMGWGVSDRGIAFLKRGLECIWQPPIYQGVNTPLSVESVENKIFRVVQELQPGISLIPLASEIGIDYQKLQNLLAAGEWANADHETYRLMLRNFGKEHGQLLEKRDIENFPNTDLLTIDKLWMKFSNNHFGFSAQRKIWVEHGGPMEENNELTNVFSKFGWMSGSIHLMTKYSDLQKQPSTSPIGELPFGVSQPNFQYFELCDSKAVEWAGLWVSLFLHKAL